jgi:cytosine permease
MSQALPSYIASATPNPMEKRAPWYKNTAPTYAGIFLWFVFWDLVPTAAPNLGGTLAQGLGVALGGLVISALICHYLFYLVPGLLGMKTGLPLYIVGTSTFGAQGGFIMPGFLMGVLQFGWLGVNTFASSMLLYNAFASTAIGPATGYPVTGHAVLAVAWAVLAAFMGLKGIQYVARVASLLPLIPLAILLYLLLATVGGVSSFSPDKLIAAQKISQGFVASAAPDPLSTFGVIALLITYVVGFFATAGAAGVDFGMNNRDKKDVKMGGLVGVALAALFTAGASILIVAGFFGKSTVPPQAFTVTGLLPAIVGPKTANALMFLLAIAAFPPACFSSFIAANCFKTTLPNVKPVISVGIGTLASILLAVSGYAGQVVSVFQIIGASFGPICGAMMVDYLLSGRKWAGPRAGFNPAGWISWALGFIVGILPNKLIIPEAIRVPVPAAPVVAFLVGAAVYFVCASLGLQSEVLPMPGVTAPPSPSAKTAVPA